MYKNHIRFLAVLLAAALLLPLAQPAVIVSGGEDAPYILSFADAQSASRFVRGEASAHVLTEEGTLVTAALSASEAAALQKDRDVDALERDATVRANTASQTAAAADGEALYWNALAVGADDAHAQGLTGKGVRVAVLDAGVDLYSEVQPCAVVDLVDPTDNGDDFTGHGTAVAGILAAPVDGQGVIGVAPDAAICNVRVLDAHNEAPVSRIVEAVDWCMRNDVDIINMSFGTTQYSALLDEKLHEAAEKGILLVASAGNGDTVEYPAKFPDVLSVASVDSGMMPSEDGVQAELFAPGENIYTDSLLGGYGACSGTSVASPHVAGAAAVLWSKDPTQPADYIRALLSASAAQSGVPDLGYALELFDGFTARYPDGGYTTPQNPAPAENYADDDVFVTGSWSSTGHNALADNYYSDTAQNIRFPLLVKRVSASMDANMSGDKLLHGVSNYIAVSELLFEIACGYKTQGFGAFTHSDCRRDLIPILGESAYNTLLADVSRAFTLHGALNTAVDSEDRLLGATDFTSVSEKASVIAFGMFFHLIGDIYAHRTVVPTTCVQSTSAVSHGTGSGGNDGLYFVIGDFNTDCGAHKPDRSAAIRAQYRETLSKLRNGIAGQQGFSLAIAVLKWLGFLVFGRWILSLQDGDASGAEQMRLDEELLQSAVNIPSNATFGNMCGTHSSCSGALLRLGGMGVLQFKDVKYFLRGMDAYAESGARSDAFRTNWNYYEDQAPTNAFYTRRFLLAKAVTKYCCQAFDTAGSVPFSPYYLLPEPYGDAVSKYCLKIDQFYNYLLALDRDSELLTRAFWAGKTHGLFCYTTIVYEGTYFIDASTYPDAYGKPVYSGVFPPRTDGKTADSFYR